MKKWIQEQKQFKNERGLTLVELLAVIVILAIVATIAFVAIGNVMENSRQDALIGNAQQMIESAKLYEANSGTIEGDGIDLDNLQGETDENIDVLEQIYDPWNKNAITGDSGRIKIGENGYEVYLKGSKKTIGSTSKFVPEADIIKADRKELFE